MNRTALDQYEELVTDALKSYSAKLRKSFKTAFIQLMILYMVLPRKINFTQMGRYSDSSEQRFRQLFEREFDWIQFNLFLMRQRFGESVRKAIAIDVSYISTSGKKTPYIGKFWSGCASQVKRGVEILGIGIIDIDSRDCMMPPCGMHMTVSAQASVDGRVSKAGRLIFEKLDLQRCEIRDIEGGRAYSVKAYSKAMKRNIKVVVHYPESGGHKIYFSTDLDMSARDIIEYYRTRFQIEFCFRDSKQFTGINDCQARDLRKLDFAFNASLASVNIAKVMRQRYYPSLSIGLLKAYLSNIYMLKRMSYFSE